MGINADPFLSLSFSLALPLSVIIMLSLWLLTSMEPPEMAFTHYHPFLSGRLPSSCERGQTGPDFLSLLVL